MSLADFEALLTPTEHEQLAALDSPAKIQAYLDDTPYSTDSFNRCPVRVMRERVAHCLDGALFAALCLWKIGFPPLIVEMLPEPGLDDDHLLAIYKVGGRYGAVAKSNFSGLRLREPVYQGIRELVMSYFESFFNVNGVRTLRAYTRPLNLAAYVDKGWMVSDEGVDFIEHKVYALKPIPLVTGDMVKRLTPVDPLSYQAGTLVTNPAGLYKPKG